MVFLNSLAILRSLRDNQDEVIRRWLDNVHKHVAEDFEQTLRAPMGKGVAVNLLGCVTGFFGAEDFQEGEALRRLRDVSYQASYRRAAVGFGLPDIVAACQAFHAALRETILNHVNPASAEETRELLDGIVALNRLEDTAIMGRIAGYFAYHHFHDSGEDEVA